MFSPIRKVQMLKTLCIVTLYCDITVDFRMDVNMVTRGLTHASLALTPGHNDGDNDVTTG